MKLEFENSDLKISLEWWEKLLAFHGSWRIPVETVIGVSLEPPKTSWRQVRAPGSFISDLIKAGTYHTPHGREFWMLTRTGKPLVLELAHHNYDRLVLGVDDNQYWKMLIESKVKRNSAYAGQKY